MSSPSTAGGILQGVVVLESRGLRKNFGTGEKKLEVLTDANLELHEGEMVAIVAPSGAGKSTLLHLLGALDTPTSGTVYFAHKAIETNEDAALAEFRNRAVGFLWQRHQLPAGFYSGRERSDAVAGAWRVTASCARSRAQMAGGSWAAKTGPDTVQENFRRGTAACSDCPGRSSQGRACCWRMNRPEIWTSRMLGPCSSCLNGCIARIA